MSINPHQVAAPAPVAAGTIAEESVNPADGGTNVHIAGLVSAVDAVTSVLTNFLSALGFALYHTSPATRANGQAGPLEADSNGNLLGSLGTRLAGEDLAADVMKVELRYAYNNITTQTTTPVKGSAGFLHALTINTPAVNGVITIYDNTAAAGNKVGTITFPATLQSTGPVTVFLDVSFATGLTIVTAGASMDITVSYR